MVWGFRAEDIKLKLFWMNQIKKCNMWSWPADPEYCFKPELTHDLGCWGNRRARVKGSSAEGRLKTQPLLSLLCLATSHHHLNPTIHQLCTMKPPQLPPVPPPPPNYPPISPRFGYTHTHTHAPLSLAYLTLLIYDNLTQGLSSLPSNLFFLF